MKKFLSILLLFISMISVGQNYTISPSHEVNMTPAFDELTITDIYMLNTASTDIQLKWKLISNKLYPGWDFSLCDYTTCYPGLPNEGTMTPVPPGEKGFLGLNVVPYKIAGTGVVKMYVYQEGYMDKGDTLTWFVTATASGITQINRSVNISLFPNPAKELLTVEVDATDLSIASIQVTDLLGKVWINKTIGQTQTKVDVADLPNGYYLIQYKHGNEISGMEKLCVAR